MSDHLHRQLHEILYTITPWYSTTAYTFIHYFFTHACITRRLLLQAAIPVVNKRLVRRMKVAGGDVDSVHCPLHNTFLSNGMPATFEAL